MILPPKAPESVELSKTIMHSDEVRRTVRDALETFSKNGNIGMLSLMLDFNVYLTMKPRGNIELMTAIRMKDPSAVGNLLAADIDFNVERSLRGDALKAAVNSYSIIIVEQLLMYGVDVDSLSKEGRTALYTAAGQGFVHIVITLLGHGAAVDFTARFSQRTPLKVAAENGRIFVIPFLLIAGADPCALFVHDMPNSHSSGFRNKKHIDHRYVEAVEFAYKELFSTGFHHTAHSFFLHCWKPSYHFKGIGYFQNMRVKLGHSDEAPCRPASEDLIGVQKLMSNI